MMDPVRMSLTLDWWCSFFSVSGVSALFPFFSSHLRNGMFGGVKFFHRNYEMFGVFLYVLCKLYFFGSLKQLQGEK